MTQFLRYLAWAGKTAWPLYAASVLTTNVIGALGVATFLRFLIPLDEAQALTNPDTITVLVLIYRYAFVINHDFGMAAAMSLLLFIVLGLFSALYLRITRD